MLYRASNGSSDVLNPLSFILSRVRSVKRPHITSRRYRKDFPQANHDDLLLKIQMKARRGRGNADWQVSRDLCLASSNFGFYGRATSRKIIPALLGCQNLPWKVRPPCPHPTAARRHWIPPCV